MMFNEVILPPPVSLSFYLGASHRTVDETNSGERVVRLVSVRRNKRVRNGLGATKEATLGRLVERGK